MARARDRRAPAVVAVVRGGEGLTRRPAPRFDLLWRGGVESPPGGRVSTDRPAAAPARSRGGRRSRRAAVGRAPPPRGADLTAAAGVCPRSRGAGAPSSGRRESSPATQGRLRQHRPLPSLPQLRALSPSLFLFFLVRSGQRSPPPARWVLDGSVPTQQTRVPAAMAVAPARRVLILFGGLRHPPLPPTAHPLLSPLLSYG